MHSFENLFAENGSKTLLWRVYAKVIVRINLNTITSTTVKHFLKQYIVFTILLPEQEKTFLCRVYPKAIV